MELILTVLIFGAIYFLPTIWAYSNKKKNVTPVFLLNLLLGWTVLGWIIALIWGASKD